MSSPVPPELCFGSRCIQEGPELPLECLGCVLWLGATAGHQTGPRRGTEEERECGATSEGTECSDSSEGTKHGNVWEGTTKSGDMWKRTRHGDTSERPFWRKFTDAASRFLLISIAVLCH